MKISPNGSWDGLNPEAHSPFDPYLSSALISFLKKEKATSVVDLGCGTGQYTKALNEGGVSCRGLDGNPNTLKITNGKCQTIDLSKTVSLGQYDWVLSLEVGEHIPKDSESIFLDNINKASRFGIILSWAIEGQGGYGHVNERSNEYIQNKIKEFDYSYLEDASLLLRSKSSLGWFKNTIMVFKSLRVDQ